MIRLRSTTLAATAAALVFSLAGAASATTAEHGSTGASPAPAANGDLLITINGNLYLIAANGSNKRQLTSGGGISDAAFSPDGRRIVFGRGSGTNADLFVMKADGTNVVNWTRTAGVGETNPAWSPDGRRIAFTRNATANSGDGIAVMNAAPGASATLIKRNRHTANSANLYSEPVWSPSGNRIAYQDVLDWEGSCTPVYVRQMTPAGANISMPEMLGYTPDYDPTGNWLAATEEDCGIYWLVKRNLSTGQKVNITRPNDSPADWYPVWSPDGAKVAYSRSRSAGGGWVEDLAIVGTGGGAYTRILMAGPGQNIRPRDWRAR